MRYVVIVRAFINLDDILPVLFELEVRGIIFVINGPELTELVKRNSLIYDAIKHLNGKTVTLYPTKNKLINIFCNIWALRRHFYKPLITIEHAIGSKMIDYILRFNRVIGGKRILSLIYNVPFKAAKSHKYYGRVIRGKY